MKIVFKYKMFCNENVLGRYFISYIYMKFRDSFHQIQFLYQMYMCLKFRDAYHQIQFLYQMYMCLKFRDSSHQIQFLYQMYVYLRFRDSFHQIQFLYQLYMYFKFRDSFHLIHLLYQMYMYLKFRDSFNQIQFLYQMFSVPEVQRLTKNLISVSPVTTAESTASHQSLQFSDTNSAIFQGSYIYGWTFNISVNFQSIPTAKRPRMEMKVNLF